MPAEFSPLALTLTIQVIDHLPDFSSIFRAFLLFFKITYFRISIHLLPSTKPPQSPHFYPASTCVGLVFVWPLDPVDKALLHLRLRLCSTGWSPGVMPSQRVSCSPFTRQLEVIKMCCQNINLSMISQVSKCPWWRKHQNLNKDPNHGSLSPLILTLVLLNPDFLGIFCHLHKFSTQDQVSSLAST